MSEGGYVLWRAARATVQGSDPYSDEVTEENNIYYYGSLARSHEYEPQGFSYPLFAILPLLPLGWLDFHAAGPVLLVLFGILAALWVGWLRAAWDARTLLYTVLIFASYPVLYDVVSLQPTLLFLALAIGGLALLRSDRFIVAAVTTALSMSKPQVAAPVLLPLLVSTVAGPKEYRRFVAWLVLFGAGLSSVAAMFQPRWIAEWLSAARNYVVYSPRPMVSGWFGSAAPAISGLIVLALIMVLWACRHSDLLFRVSLSVVLLYPLLPYRSYNAAVFMIPIVWLADNTDRVKAGGALHEVALGFARVAVIALWVFTAAGAALLWSSMWKVGFMLPILGLHLLFFSLCAVMLAQCASEFRTRQAKTAVANATLDANSYSDLPKRTATLSE